MKHSLPRRSNSENPNRKGHMKAWAVLVLVLAVVGTAGAQVVTGRSNTGMISVAAPLVEDGSTKKTQPLTIEIEFSEPSGNKHLDAKETGRLRVVITNTSRSVVREVVARVSPLVPPTAVTYNDSIVVGDIPTNASRYAIFYFAAGESVPSQIVTFQVALFSRQVEAAEPRLLTFLTRGTKGE
jgi:hypothetical protein